MTVYDDIVAETQLGGKFEKLEKVRPEEIKTLRKDQPEIPEDFFSFLEEIGSGELGYSEYSIYNGCLRPDEVYDENTAEELKDILIFGDDMQGYCSGFNARDGWTVVEIDPTDMSYEKTHNTFSEFIRDKLQSINE